MLVLLAMHVVLPQRSGALALSQVLEPYICLTALIAAPLALRDRSLWSKAFTAVLVAATVLRYGPGWVSLPSAPAGEPDRALRVVTWNLLAPGAGAARALAGLGEVDADLIGVQELQRDVANALGSDASLMERLPHRVLAPEATVLGMGLLSRFPISDERVSTDPPYLSAQVELPDGERVAVVVVHPLPARFVQVAGVPIALDTSRRDASIAVIRAVIDAHRAAGLPTIVLGDLNTTEREPAWAEFTAGLHDAHLDAGLGPGFTWRPPALEFLPLGLLRIDYILASPEFAAVSSTVDCGVASDHCLLDATLVRLSAD